MNHQRQKHIDGIVLLLRNKLEALLGDKEGCSFECRSMMYGALAKEMHSKNLLSPRPKPPFPGLSYQSLVNEVVSFQSPDWFDSNYKWQTSLGDTHRLHACTHSTIASLLGRDDIFGWKVGSKRIETIEGLLLMNFTS